MKLYPLELNDTKSLRENRFPDFMEMSELSESTVDVPSAVNRPQWRSAQRVTAKMKEWTRVLAISPKDVMETEQLNI